MGLWWLVINSVLFGIENYVALDRNPGPGYTTQLLSLIAGDFYSACPRRQFYNPPDLIHVVLHCQTIDFMMVFDMTRPGREPAAYCMRGGQANH